MKSIKQKRTPYYLKDEQSGNYLSLRYTTPSSDSLEFSEVESRNRADGFLYEENAELYAERYEKIYQRKAIISEEWD